MRSVAVLFCIVVASTLYLSNAFWFGGQGMGQTLNQGQSFGQPFGQQFGGQMFGQQQTVPARNKCMDPLWLQSCSCAYSCPAGSFNYGQCDEYRENSYLPFMCCPEMIHYFCVGFE